MRYGLGASSACALALGGWFVAGAAAQIRIVNYNVAQLNGNQTALEGVFSALAADDKPGFAAAPHVFVFQEVQSTDVGPLGTRLNAAGAAFGVTYTAATYTNNGENGTAGAQALFYRSDLVAEDPAGHVDIFTGGGRYTDRWKLELVGYTDPPVEFYVFSSHLKASTGSSNEAERLTGAQAIRDNADALPAGTLILYCGDFNVYSNGEAAYQEFLSAGAGQALDPLGAGSWSGGGNAWKHTQSPRDVSGTLVGGGMDDRFDFQLSTAGWHDGEGLALIAGSYRSFGNDGGHYNLAINSGNNSYYPADVPRSNALADLLFDASDHVPVVADYQLPAVLAATLTPSFGRVIEGAAVAVDVLVDNAAPVIAASGVGADELEYVVTASGDLSGGGAGTVLARIPAQPEAVALAVDTASAGAKAGQVTVTTSSEQAQGASALLAISGQVVRRSAVSFASGSVEKTAHVRYYVEADSGVYDGSADVYNVGFDADQSAADVDAVTGLGGALGLTGPLPDSIGASPAAVPLAYDSTGQVAGLYTWTVQIQCSDEDIPGETTDALTLEFEVRVTRLLGDLNDDCIIDLADLAPLLQSYGTCAGDPFFVPQADLDLNDCIELADLGFMLGRFGMTCP